jgi:hypothetical protein
MAHGASGAEGPRREGRDKRAYRESAAQVFGRATETIELLSPQETADLLERHKVRQQATGGRAAGPRSFAMTAREPAVIENLLQWLAARLGDRELVLFRAASSDFGAICTTTSELLPRALQLMLQDRSSVLASSRDGSFGVALEGVADRQAAGDPLYKLVAWGVPA